jgi:hypothetical protein
LIGAEILEAQQFAGAEILPDAEISTSALVLSYIIRRMNFTCPQQISAAIFRSNFTQQFSAAVFRRKFPQQFSQKFSALVLRRSFLQQFPQKFSAANFRLIFPHPPQFS